MRYNYLTKTNKERITFHQMLHDMDMDFQKPSVQKKTPKKSSKQKCKRVWASYGIFMITMPFLQQLEQISMQRLNQF